MLESIALIGTPTATAFDDSNKHHLQEGTTMGTMTIGSYLEAASNREPLNLVGKKLSAALSLKSDIPVGYVEPTVSFDGEAPPSGAPILLISAAGAMGKSYTSKAIANQLGCPRLDLGQVTVGQASHSGLLNKTLKATSFGNYMSRLELGTASLVIDALDEAPIRSGERAFFAFMESLIEDAEDFEVSNHQYIILGRPLTIELFRTLGSAPGFVDSLT